MIDLIPQNEYIAVVLQVAFALGFVGATMIATHIIGSRSRRSNSALKMENFECGIEAKGNARFPFSVKYFLMAIFFVLFDVEIIFFYPWAVNFKSLGLPGFYAMIVFLFYKKILGFPRIAFVNINVRSYTLTAVVIRYPYLQQISVGSFRSKAESSCKILARINARAVVVYLYGAAIEDRS